MGKVQHVWHKDKRVCDLLDKERCATSSIDHIRAEWGDLYDVLQERGELKDFYSPRNTLAAIETGVIAGMYKLSQDAAEALGKKGLDSIESNASSVPASSLNQIRDLKGAMDGVFDYVGQQRPLTISLIKELHLEITFHQTKVLVANRKQVARESDFLRVNKGVWKDEPNNVMRNNVEFQYCPPLQVQSEMERLLKFHTKHEEDGVPGEISAAWLHHRFTQIHPFQDGNGRMARIMSSIVLLKNRLYPLVVLRGDREQYIKKLRQADAGDLRPLIDYFSSLQAREHLVSLNVLRGMPEGSKLDNALAEKRRERLAVAKSCSK